MEDQTKKTQQNNSYVKLKANKTDDQAAKLRNIEGYFAHGQESCGARYRIMLGRNCGCVSVENQSENRELSYQRGRHKTGLGLRRRKEPTFRRQVPAYAQKGYARRQLKKFVMKIESFWLTAYLSGLRKRPET